MEHSIVAAIGVVDVESFTEDILFCIPGLFPLHRELIRVLLQLNPGDVLPRDDDQPDEPTRHVHLDLVCVRGGRFFSSCLDSRGAGEAIFMSAGEDDIPILCGGK